MCKCVRLRILTYSRPLDTAGLGVRKITILQPVIFIFYAKHLGNIPYNPLWIEFRYSKPRMLRWIILLFYFSLVCFVSNIELRTTAKSLI